MKKDVLKIKVYITKYALTKGIIEASIPDPAEGVIIYFKGKRFKQPEWHLSQSEAITEAEIMRKRKIVALRKSISKLEAKSFIQKSEHNEGN
jgi:hypothetical protein